VVDFIPELVRPRPVNEETVSQETTKPPIGGFVVWSVSAEAETFHWCKRRPHINFKLLIYNTDFGQENHFIPKFIPKAKCLCA
jgi:hypothetical protein